MVMKIAANSIKPVVRHELSLNWHELSLNWLGKLFVGYHFWIIYTISNTASQKTNVRSAPAVSQKLKFSYFRQLCLVCDPGAQISLHAGGRHGCVRDWLEWLWETGQGVGSRGSGCCCGCSGSSKKEKETGWGDQSAPRQRSLWPDAINHSCGDGNGLHRDEEEMLHSAAEHEEEEGCTAASSQLMLRLVTFPLVSCIH